jgi:phosphoglycerol transferase MdoB-like AlkP superfamily enzyme
MKLKRWEFLKIALIVLPTVGVVTYRAESAEDAWSIVLYIAVALSFAAVFQLVFWCVYDVMTFKRGGWSVAKFSDSPFARSPGPGFFLNIESVALLIFGAAKIVAAIFQGLPSLILGAGFFAVGALLLVWQVMLRKLFQSRFFERSHHNK